MSELYRCYRLSGRYLHASSHPEGFRHILNVDFRDFGVYTTTAKSLIVPMHWYNVSVAKAFVRVGGG